MLSVSICINLRFFHKKERKIFVTGEVTSKAKVDVEKVVKDTLKAVGYRTDYEIVNNIGVQSPDIAQGVDIGGAGDQGMMFGYACRDTEDYIPVAMKILQELSKTYDILFRKDKRFLPDGKAQITGFYENGKLKYIQDFVISYQNTEVEREETDKILMDICKGICEEYGIEIKAFHINPTGKFLIGGFDGDAGLTGRKIVVDNYQSFANVGGGAFSGKDCTKVDRSAAYAARHIAKNMVAAGVADEMLVQLSYAIGVAEPVSVYVNTYGRSHVNMTDGEIARLIPTIFSLTPKAIENRLKLRKPIYEETAAYGHMGREPKVVIKQFESLYNGGNISVPVELFTWEKLDYKEKIKEVFFK